MKLLFAILLMSTVISSELSNIINVSGNDDICLMDTSNEGEVEKDASENLEDIVEVKIKQDVNFGIQSKRDTKNKPSIKWLISTPYLEIHSPPPDQM